MANMIAAGPGVLAPPTELHANQTFAWLFVICLAAVIIGELVYAVADARRTRSPLLGLLILGGATVGAFAIEPTYDIVMATWYPYDLPMQLFAVVGRPMALMVVLAWIQIGITAYIAYRVVAAGWSVVKILGLFATMSLIEGVMEMACVHFGVMNYYGNHATVFGVPFPTLVQNAGMFAIIGVALATIVPHLRSWRWLVIPFVVGMLYIGYVLSCTLPNFLAIHGQASTPVFWLAAAASSIMNGGVAVAALYMPVAQQHRRAAQTRWATPSRSTADPASVTSPIPS